MLKTRWLLAFPLVLLVSLGSARGSSIRDDAGMFDPDTVRQAEAKLKQAERETGISTVIETIASLDGQDLRAVAVDRAKRSGSRGVFVLIVERDHKIDVRSFRDIVPRDRLVKIEDAFRPSFRKGNFDEGLRRGVDEIVQQIKESAPNGARARAGQLPVGPPPRRGLPQRGGGFGVGTLIFIGLGILAVLFVLRLLGSLFRGGYAGGPGRMGGPGYGPGPGPGYGYGGGGGGGGFWSSLMGGIGGAMAGNWIYDQFSGRHHGGDYADNTGYGAGTDVGAGQDASTGADWSTGTEGDWSGGDAGGGGGGGDWGGGGGDGGGDWGGGGGGDWGGGGGGDGGGGDW